MAVDVFVVIGPALIIFFLFLGAIIHPLRKLFRTSAIAILAFYLIFYIGPFCLYYIPARLGYSESQRQLGLWYAYRFGGNLPDRDRWKYWMKRSAEGGNINAMVTLGAIYINEGERADQRGESGDKDRESARRWLNLAKDAGAPRAAQLLDSMDLSEERRKNNPFRSR